MTEPALKQWQDIYRRALAFRELAPWEWIPDTVIFAVQDPLIVYISR